MTKTNQTAPASIGGKATRTELALRAARKIKLSSANERVHPHRYLLRPVELREIHKFQKLATLIIRKLLFQRLVREIAQDRERGVHFQASAIEALQHTTEDMIVELFEDS